MDKKKDTSISIFDIQRNSFVDGPGIRTTVFFKGCNLKCSWCHNPESQTSKPELMFYKNLCIHCGECERVCPNKLAKCTACGACTEVCPSNARKLCGYTKTSEEIYEIVKKDKPFYDATGGGVTFSGGECMLQYEGLCEVEQCCKNGGILTAIDTAGNVSQDHFKKILPFTDIILYDIKCMDNETHLKYTGTDNSLILENLHFLLSTVPNKIIIRIPVIPEVNMNVIEQRKLKKFFSENNTPRDIEFLPYHRLGEHKYSVLSRTIPHFTVPNEKLLKKYISEII